LHRRCGDKRPDAILGRDGIPVRRARELLDNVTTSAADASEANVTGTIRGDEITGPPELTTCGMGAGICGIKGELAAELHPRGTAVPKTHAKSNADAIADQTNDRPL